MSTRPVGTRVGAEIGAADSSSLLPPLPADEEFGLATGLPFNVVEGGLVVRFAASLVGEPVVADTRAGGIRVAVANSEPAI